MSTVRNELLGLDAILFASVPFTHAANFSFTWELIFVAAKLTKKANSQKKSLQRSNVFGKAKNTHASDKHKTISFGGRQRWENSSHVIV